MTESTGRFHLTTGSADQTEHLAEQLGTIAVPGLVIALVGDLGAGKTTFVRGLARGLEIDPAVVSSPTFVLIHEYDGRLPMFHFDPYRLTNLASWVELGVDEYIESDGVCVIEWANRVEHYLPDDRLGIQFEHIGEQERRITVDPGGPISRQVARQWKNSIPTT